MEITTLSKTSIKIKGKNASLVIDPEKSISTKTKADAIILLSKPKDYDNTKIEEHRVVIQAPGEYEVSGIKISAHRFNHDLVYQMSIDGLRIGLANSSSIENGKDKLSDLSVVILHATAPVDESAIAVLAPRLVILYGVESKDRLNKFSVTAERLPEEMETVLLSV